ncbi:RNA binding protein, putative [Cordyceps militaris CM01]|uniref:RNA binding protein, putative n=2 Tax=Cordyceps militaris TaxID=73501 RepID=G3JLH5_CORMM|nr:RNA binding protein, putative [Cordyceps militaris CM01]ATY63168.1 RNA binding [Cordyceps militaris]EGX90549.1 RNA binding protein, putative [Cordyceps militaris CM01]
MTRGETLQTKCHYKGNHDDFIIFIDDVETYNKWKTDKSIPMAHFISSFKIFVTNKHGAQGQLDAAPNNILATEFDTENEDEVIKKILDKGNLQQSEMPARQGQKNDSKGAMTAH